MLNVNEKSNNSKYLAEKASKIVFLSSAFVAVLSLLVIIGFVFYKGLTPFLAKDIPS